MKLGIDLSNISIGGGVTHIAEVLNAVQPERYGIEQITIWTGKGVKDLLPARRECRVLHERMLDESLPRRIFWQNRILPRLAREACDLLFVPRGGSAGGFSPYVTMSQNLLPFDWGEMRRYGVSWMLLRLACLRRLQTKGFRTAGGTIFLSEYARSMVLRHTGPLPNASTIIPHGISRRFFLSPRPQRPKGDYGSTRPFRILYTSVVDVFKHQWKLAEAASLLRREGYPVALDLVGPAYPPSLTQLNRTLDRVDPGRDFVRYHGSVPYDRIVAFYHQADAYAFASTCETFGQVLLEAMASGLPILSSRRGPMPELLRDAGVYCDAEQPVSIAEALRAMIDDPSLRAHLADGAYRLAGEYSWERCAHETFSFLTDVAGGGKGRRES